MPSKAVFLDKDGTINEDMGYLSDPDKIRIIPGSAEAIKKLNEAGFKVIVISNQSGIARGHLTENILQNIDKKIQRELLKDGAFFDAMYYCPHHPEHGLYPYKKACECRKPHPGLVKKAVKEKGIELNGSYFVGDKLTDVLTGKAAGTKTVLVLTGRGRDAKKEKDFSKNMPDFEAKDLLEAAEWILKDKEGKDRDLGNIKENH